jgi:hypothetical protein
MRQGRCSRSIVNRTEPIVGSQTRSAIRLRVLCCMWIIDVAGVQPVFRHGSGRA